MGNSKTPRRTPQNKRNETQVLQQLLSTFEKRKTCLQRSIFWLAPLQQLCLAAPVVSLTTWDRGLRPPVAFSSKLLVLTRVVFPQAPQPDSATVTSVVEPRPPNLISLLTLRGLVELSLEVKLTPRPKVEVVPWLALRVKTRSALSSIWLLSQVTPTALKASRARSLRTPTHSGVQPTKVPSPFLQVQTVSSVSMTSSQDSETESSCRALAIFWLLSLAVVQV